MISKRPPGREFVPPTLPIKPGGRVGHTHGSLGGDLGNPREKAISQTDKSSQRVPGDFAKINKIHNRRLDIREGTSAAEQLSEPCLTR